MTDQLDPSDDGEDTTLQAGGEVEVALLARGTSVGRYTVLELIGRGGMGAVYKAYDPELDRSIALKVISPQSSGSESTIQVHGRVMREAQALAQLSHPNVVAVFDVGKYEGAVYIAMELVEGKTGREWLQEGRPTRREVLEVFRQAGEGLLAAHQAGLVHRDFKPGNVILGKDGRVRVADFGLVRSLNAPPPSEMEPSVKLDAVRGREISLETGKYLSASLTLSGRIQGTPHYMSPEQFRGKAIDARTDQYSFCVCLFEALYGERPFEGRDLSELMDNVVGGRRAEPAGAVGVPSWLRDILLKGFALDPADRYPSIRELLDALRADPEEAAQRAREARRRSLKHAGIGAVLATGVAVLLGVFLSRGQEQCRGAEDLAALLWNEDTQGKVRAAFVATGRPYAADTFERVDLHLAKFEREWSRMHHEACEATYVQREQSEQVFDLRMECLRRKHANLKTLAGLFGEKPDVAVMDKAVEASLELRGVGFCADVKALSQAVPPPESPEARKTVEELRGQLEEARVREKLGRYEEARSLLAEVRPRVEALGYLPLVGELCLQESQTLSVKGKYAEAEARGREALQTGLEVRDWDLALRAAQGLTGLVGVKAGRHQEGMSYAQTAIGLSKNLGEEREANTILVVGSVFLRQGKFAEAEANYRRALERYEASVGPEHPVVANVRNNLALVYLALGRFGEAEEEFRRAIAIREKAFGPDHPEAAVLKNNLGNAFLSQRRFKEAEEEFREVLGRFISALGPEHPHVATARLNVALSLQFQGKAAEALEEHRKALGIREKTLGPRHPDVAESRNSIGDALLASGKVEEAEAQFRLGLDIAQEAFGPDHSWVSEAVVGLAKVRMQQNRLSEALPLLERAQRISEKASSTPARLSDLKFLLARALWTKPREHGRARTLAMEAAQSYTGLGERYAAERNEVERWLDEHR